MRSDPITFEILKNRLWAINDEAAATIRVVSGSPVATDVADYNTALLTAEGDVFVIGSYIAIHAISLEYIVKGILKEYRENPGINEDDMFICNNPYEGAMHQNDVALVAPIHWEGELIAWAGAAIHQIDIGGPSPGQVQVGARSIFEEAPLIPCVKIIERGNLRKDIERLYLIHSRVPHLVRLDLRAKIASNNVVKNRIYALIRKYGPATVKGVIDEIVNYTENKFKARLEELPNGTWRHQSYLDYEGKFYMAKLGLTKRDDTLTYDLTGTSRQAPAVINCTYEGTLAGILTTLLTYLCFDIPWCPSGIMKAIKVISTPGTFLHASWPAGVSKATTSGNHILINVASGCMAKLLASSEKYRDRVMCIWSGNHGVEELFGIDQRGSPFGGTIQDAGMAGGSGARSYKDGIDTGGVLVSTSCTIPNVETYEFRYPILYLYRRHAKDSGGPGKFRGGVAMEVMNIAYGVEEIPTKILHGFGVEKPESEGICGGYPGNTHWVKIKRNSNILDLFKRGELPIEMEEIEGEVESPPPIVATYMKKNDVYKSLFTAGGGGYGDPLDRNPFYVELDVKANLVSLQCATEIYGVIIDPQSLKVDLEATHCKREKIRKEREESSSLTHIPSPIGRGAGVRGVKETSIIDRINEYLLVVEAPPFTSPSLGRKGLWRGGEKVVKCSKCDLVLGSAQENYKNHLFMRESPIQKAGPLIDPDRIGEDKFVFREFFCPHCFTLVNTEINFKDEDFIWDVQLSGVGNVYGGKVLYHL